MLTDPSNYALYNPGAEQSVIGSMLYDKAAQYHLDSIRPDDFVEMNRQMIVRVMQQMRDKKQPIDLVTLELDNGATQEAIACMQYTPTSANALAYVKIIKEAAMRRYLLDVAQRITATVSDPTVDVVDAIEQARQLLLEASQDKSDWMDMRTMVRKTFEWMDARRQGKLKPIQSGIPDLDRIIGGFFPGELTIIGARPGAGKSAMGMNIALAAAKAGHKAAFVSLEMVCEQLGQRVFSQRAGINGMKMRNANLSDGEWEKIIEVMGPVSNLPISWLFNCYTIEDIVSQVRYEIDRNGVDMLILDYLQLCGVRRKVESDRLRVAYVSSMCKRMTRDFGIPVIAMAQVNRDASETMPNIADLRDCGNIEQDADNIIFLHEPKDASDKSVYKLDKPVFDEINATGKKYIAVEAAKQRNGQTGKLSLIFDPGIMKYYGVQRPYAGGNN